jgi:hypothetical protein
VFFDVFQARVYHLFHAKHLGTQQILNVIDMAMGLINSPVCVGETNIDRACEIVEALIVNEDTDQHGKRGERGCGKRSHQLVRSNHSFSMLPNEFFGLVALVVTIEHVHHADLLHRDRR